MDIKGIIAIGICLVFAAFARLPDMHGEDTPSTTSSGAGKLHQWYLHNASGHFGV